MSEREMLTSKQGAKRHRWRHGVRFSVCRKCGCRYRAGFLDRTYEQPDGRRTTAAEACKGART